MCNISIQRFANQITDTGSTIQLNLEFSACLQKWTYTLIYEWLSKYISVKASKTQETTSYFLFLFSFSFVVFWVSMLYQTWWFIRIIIGRQPKSIFNPLYSNTSSLAYRVSFKCLGEFFDRFWIPYYEHIIDHFSAKKALAFIKLIVEDCMQFLIQILFLWRRNLTDGVYFQILISLS